MSIPPAGYSVSLPIITTVGFLAEPARDDAIGWTSFELYAEDRSGGYSVCFNACLDDEDCIRAINHPHSSSHLDDGDLFNAVIEAAAPMLRPHLAVLPIPPTVDAIASVIRPCPTVPSKRDS